MAEKSKISNSTLKWKEVRNSKSWVLALIISLLFLVTWSLFTPKFFSFIQQRQGRSLNDFVLNIVPASDVSLATFITLYGVIVTSLFSLFRMPAMLIVGVQAYAILTLMRIITLILVPLENPDNLIPLNDPFVDGLFYQQPITKDLFFSGHTSLTFLLAFCLRKTRIFPLLILAATAIGVFVLVQHAHYTIDVIAAPVAAYLSLMLSKSIMNVQNTDIIQ